MVECRENAGVTRVAQFQHRLVGGARHELGADAFPAVIALHGGDGERAERVERGDAADQPGPVGVVLGVNISEGAYFIELGEHRGRHGLQQRLLLLLQLLQRRKSLLDERRPEALHALTLRFEQKLLRHRAQPLAHALRELQLETVLVAPEVGNLSTCHTHLSSPRAAEACLCLVKVVLQLLLRGGQ